MTSSSQGFIVGDSSGTGGARMREAVAPHVVAQSGSKLHIRCGDGEADLYVSEGGMMANHILGRDPWQLLVAGARSANWVILALDRPVCLTAQSQRTELPDGLAGDAILVRSGAELLRVVTGA